MWKKIVFIIAVLLLLTGLGFLLFPPISNSVGQIKANGVIEKYEEDLQNVVDELVDETDGTVVKTFEEAKKRHLVDDEGYLIRWTNSRSWWSGGGGGYERVPDKKPLPIYLGANDEMMGYGAAHLNNTSLPLNEKSTNCVVAGHTGYVGRIFFDNIRNLKKGDKVDVKNFWGTIHYKVVNFKKVEPNQTTDTVIQNGKKLLTLVTCTQLGNGKYGRYLVICDAK